MALFNFVTGILTGKTVEFLWILNQIQFNVPFSGLYAGIYLTQNYNVPVVPDPTSLIDKAKKFLEENKKPDKGEWEGERTLQSRHWDLEWSLVIQHIHS